MVARRLIWLLGKVDLSNIKQVLDIGSWHRLNRRYKRALCRNMQNNKGFQINETLYCIE